MEQERLTKGIWIPIEIWKDNNLTWNEKILFLEIDSYTSQDKDCFFSNQYISELLGISETNANKTLSSLIQKGYVIKTKFDGRKRYVKTALSYSTTLPCQERQGSRACGNNITINSDNNNLINKTNKEKELKEKYDALFEECWKLYNRKGSKKNAYKRWQKLTDNDKRMVKIHIPFYIQSNDRKYLKDFEGYLNGRYFENVVYDKRGCLLFDPDRKNSANYNPQAFNIDWNENRQCYRLYGIYDGGKIYDGYADDDRPNGARIMLSNAQGFIVWNSETKKWEKCCK